MKWLELGRQRDTDKMTDYELVGEIDNITRMALFEDEFFFKILRACIKELRQRMIDSGNLSKSVMQIPVWR